MLGDEKNTVIVLKDVSIKYLLLILEYVYCGSVDLEPEDVEEFKRVAASLQIKVELKLIDAEMVSQHVSSTNTLGMSCTTSESSMERSYDELMDASGVSPRKFSSTELSTSSITSKRLENNTVSIKKTINMPEPKKMKIKPELHDIPVIVQQSFVEPKQTAKRFPATLKGQTTAKQVPETLKGQKISDCVHCKKRIRQNDRTYHEKFCWMNPKRIASNCSECNKKFDVPSKLRHHIEMCHPEKKKTRT